MTSTKGYQSPEITVMEDLVFEKVCAGSGTTSCIINPGQRDGVVPDQYNPCQSCFQEYYAGYSDTVAAMPGGNIAANRERQIRSILSSGGACPGGFTNTLS